MAKKKRSTKKETMSPPMKGVKKSSSASRNLVNKKNADAEFRSRVKYKMKLGQLLQMEQSLEEGWKKDAVVKRIEQIKLGRSEFIASMQSMTVDRLLNLNLPECPKWQRDEATKAIQRIQKEERAFVEMLAGKTLDELLVLASPSLPSWRQRAVKRFIDERHNEEVKRFRSYLSGLNTSNLRLLLLSFHDEWKNEEVKNQLDIELIREHEQQVEAFVKSLNGTDIEELEATMTSTPADWRREEIIKKLDKLRIRQRADEAKQLRREHEQEVETFIKSLRGKDIEELELTITSTPPDWRRDQVIKRIEEMRAVEVPRLKAKLNGMTIESLLRLALSKPVGWQNEVICGLIIDLLPKLGSVRVIHLSATIEPGLQRVVGRAQAELRFRKEEADPVKPRIVKGWV
jgi:ribosomal protein L12E/L44/L45/RPP1/RPP2